MASRRKVKLRRIKLRGGPFDGRSAREAPTDRTEPVLLLRYLREGLQPKPGESVRFSMCRYVAKNNGIYVLDEEETGTMPSEHYVEYQGLLGVFGILRHLADDPRLLSGPEAAQCDDTALDLAEAEQLKATAVRNYREGAVKVRELSRQLSDDQLWDFLRIRLKLDLEWLDLGSLQHAMRLSTNSVQVFGLINPLRGVKSVNAEELRRQVDRTGRP